MGKTLYLECYNGISGDMTVGMLLDLGADQSALEKQLRSLPVEGFEIKIERVKKSGLDVCDFQVILDHKHENHDHDNIYLYEHIHHHGESVSQDIHNENGNVHSHHEHRGLRDVLDIIQNSAITEQAKKTASDIFVILAEAEAKAHGTTLEKVHFHEVGAVDSIVDIVAAAICLDNLDISDVIVPELYEGRGTIRCQHGVIPVPVPAVVNIAERYGISLHLTETEAELVTPTGAAIAAAVRTSRKLPERYRILRTGMGAGKRDYGRPSLLRGMLIEAETEDAECIYKLESNIDDCTGEALGYVMEQLFAAGARDVHYQPVYMKKNRPAYQINVICGEEEINKIEEIIFRETTTIGIRRVKMERTVMRREVQTIQTSLGEARVKICRYDSIIRIYPEYESVAAICRGNGMPYQDVWDKIRHEAFLYVRDLERKCEMQKVIDDILSDKENGD